MWGYLKIEGLSFGVSQRESSSFRSQGTMHEESPTGGSPMREKASPRAPVPKARPPSLPGETYSFSFFLPGDPGGARRNWSKGLEAWVARWKAGDSTVVCSNSTSQLSRIRIAVGCGMQVLNQMRWGLEF